MVFIIDHIHHLMNEYIFVYNNDRRALYLYRLGLLILISILKGFNVNYLVINNRADNNFSQAIQINSFKYN